AGKSSGYCDGLNRRNFVKLGMAGFGSLSLPTLLQAKEQAAAKRGSKPDTSVILIWLDGGPSHIDLFDMKPEAPSEYRGIWRPIKTNVSGIEISELMPELSKVADKYAIIRSMTQTTADHFVGAHRMLTSRHGPTGNGTSPSIGSITARIRGANKTSMPPYVAVPFASTIGLKPGYLGASYAGKAYDPFDTGGDPNSPNFVVDNLGLLKGMSVTRMQDRERFRKAIDFTRNQVDQSGVMASLDRFQSQAYQMVSGDAARKAFDIAQESTQMRERYGATTFGQSCLLARRLVEAGSTFVTVGTEGWDHHYLLQEKLEIAVPQLDRGVSALLTDLEERGMLEQTLVVMVGEMGRTPRMNNGFVEGKQRPPGRDHWGNAMFCFVAGGGTRGGQVIGSTTRLGDAPLDGPCTVGDLHATIYKVLGIDPNTAIVNHSGRPVPLIDEGIPVAGLFS
ncbi:MAG: DUF1501 domain-containing protein, partial [Planctomycetota bacterium]|nr:DUF1501 domain-containing protein [Planctomycetota bacterium]